MKVTIWDLDYFYASNKKNCFNPDAMKISSYHKQLGDKINFVVTQDDIYRPYDLYYIIREKEKTPGPPIDFLLNKQVRWWGKAVRMRINWKMSDAMLGCRPDYLLYPEKNTTLERAEHIRLFNNVGQPLDWVQKWENTFKNKTVIVTDPYIWCSDRESIIKALKFLSKLEKVQFLEPIWIQKITYDKDIRNEFLKLKFKKGTLFNWSIVNVKQAKDCIDLLVELKQKNPTTAVGKLIIDYEKTDRNHWIDKNIALEDFASLRDFCHYAKTNQVNIEIKMPKTRFSTPYFELFESLSIWTRDYFNRSWLEFLCIHYGNRPNDNAYYFNHPELWTEVFRDLLLQTYKYSDFIRHIVKENYISENVIPWQLWEKEFKYGI